MNVDFFHHKGAKATKKLFCGHKEKLVVGGKGVSRTMPCFPVSLVADS